MSDFEQSSRKNVPTRCRWSRRAFRVVIRPRMCFALAASAALAGCGGKFDANVTGNVSLDGQNLSTGTVSFHPRAGGPASYGQITGDGTYVIYTGREEGLPAGEYDATVVAMEMPAELRPADGGPPAAGRRITPIRYGSPATSGLQCHVTPGSNAVDLELTTQPHTAMGQNVAK